jgi:hypothetical protein
MVDAGTIWMVAGLGTFATTMYLLLDWSRVPPLIGSMKGLSVDSVRNLYKSAINELINMKPRGPISFYLRSSRIAKYYKELYG